MTTKAETVRKARQFRRRMTLPEVLLWRQLRSSPNGIKFRRQHPIGPFVLDFYCPSAKTGIEVDGIAHDMGDNPERDERRDSWLRETGISVLRIPASEVLCSLDEAIQTIVTACGKP